MFSRGSTSVGSKGGCAVTLHQGMFCVIGASSLVLWKLDSFFSGNAGVVPEPSRFAKAFYLGQVYTLCGIDVCASQNAQARFFVIPEWALICMHVSWFSLCAVLRRSFLVFGFASPESIDSAAHRSSSRC